MSSKLIPIIFIIILFGCGVKSKPAAPPEIAIQSYTNSFLDKDAEIKPSVPAK